MKSTPEPILAAAGNRAGVVAARREHPLARRFGWIVVTVLSV
jgi:hypothetical protein